MTVYKRHEKHPFRWVLGLVIFVLVLSVTFDEVFGLNLAPTSPTGGANLHNFSSQLGLSTYNVVSLEDPVGKPGMGSLATSIPPDIPEPSTLILLAFGLGALCVIRRKRA